MVWSLLKNVFVSVVVVVHDNGIFSAARKHVQREYAIVWGRFHNCVCQNLNGRGFVLVDDDE